MWPSYKIWLFVTKNSTSEACSACLITHKSRIEHTVRYTAAEMANPYSVFVEESSCLAKGLYFYTKRCLLKGPSSSEEVTPGPLNARKGAIERRAGESSLRPRKAADKSFSAPL